MNDHIQTCETKIIIINFKKGGGRTYSLFTCTCNMLRDQHREKLPHFVFALTVEPILLRKCRDRRLSCFFFKGVGRSF